MRKSYLKECEKRVYNKCSISSMFNFSKDSGFIASGILKEPVDHLGEKNTICFAMVHLTDNGNGNIFHWIEITPYEAEIMKKVLEYSIKASKDKQTK